MFNFWMALRTIKSKKSFNLTAMFSIIGLSLGVACLVVSMVIITSYLDTLKKTVIDIYGHINLVRSIDNNSSKDILEGMPISLKQQVVSYTPFLNSSAVAVNKGKMSAVFIQGFDPKTVGKVLNLNNRVIKGSLPFQVKLKDSSDIPNVWIGKRLADNFSLNIGQSINLVVPVNNSIENFSPKVQEFKIKGILSYGRYDYDSRYLITNLENLKGFAQLEEKDYGYRLSIKDSSKAPEFARNFNRSLMSNRYWASSWRSINSNLFSAIDFEKWIIFLVLMIIIVVASFNVASTLFVNVLRQFKDIAVLKSIGYSSKDIKKVFLYQGLIIGFLGYVIGLVLGFSLCYFFVFAQKKWNILNSQVYKLEDLSLSFEVVDLIVIALACLFICFLATLIPAAKGSRLSPMKGFGYE